MTRRRSSRPSPAHASSARSQAQRTLAERIRTERTQAERNGRRAETLAALFLALKGYRILARRFEAHGGEIDIVAYRPGLLVFVEVKARPTLDAAVFAVTPRTRRRIEAAAAAFMAHRRRSANEGVRYDIVALAGLRFRHIRDAWREGDRD